MKPKLSPTNEPNQQRQAISFNRLVVRSCYQAFHYEAKEINENFFAKEIFNS